MAKDDFIVLSGEISTTATINVEQIVKDTIKKIGYTYTPRVLSSLKQLSKTLSDIISHTWSGCPIDTASDVNKFLFFIFYSIPFLVTT